MQHPSGPDKARKSTEPQPGVKRKRSIEPQPPSGAPEGYPSTDDGSDKAKKWKAVEVHHLHLNYSRAEHAGHDFIRVASNMQLEISDMASHFLSCCVKLVNIKDQCDTVLFLYPSLTEFKIGILIVLCMMQPELLNGTGPQQGVTDGVPGVTKKKKRLRKAGDMERESQSEESDRAANIGLKQSLQVVTKQAAITFDLYPTVTLHVSATSMLCATYSLQIGMPCWSDL